MITKAILFDLDDTLTESKQKVTEDMVIAFTNLMAVMPVSIVTGGSFNQIKNQFINMLPEDAKFSNFYCFSQNSAECFSYENEWKKEYSYNFTEDQSDKIINALNKVIEETGFVKDEPSFGERIENRGAQVTFSALGQSAPIDLKHNWDKDQSKRKIMRDKLLVLIPEYEIGIGGTTSIDITQKGINKTLSIKWLAEKLSLNVEEMTYVGDALFEGGNDAVVKQTNVNTIETKNPKNTIEIINSIIN